MFRWKNNLLDGKLSGLFCLLALDLIWPGLRDVLTSEIPENYLFYFLESLFHQDQLMSIPWNLNERKLPQASQTFRSILADLNSTEV